ncbi:hypothetical protein GCM10009630_21340 [Kribbella jejuensis]|uniref:SnoaL-like protein n=1 Tax=Kribbella jejuensis TaxID=236068 RepID=A0A542DT65_9ACTN|nr:nuclear transport factor 2 family protein [Kribbella jejuensis]TQJ06195.1 SnoaL-like protein [Kribbella jejuensis]
MLPEVITRYLTSHIARDIDAAMQSYAADAVVTDDGKTYHGRAEIRAWLAHAANEYRYTVELTGTRKIDDHTYVASHRLEGNFSGGTADLDFTFTLAGNLITGLDIS